MSPTVTYLDHAATTPMLPEAVQAMTAHLTTTGNASSLHAAGRRVVEIRGDWDARFAAALRAVERALTPS